MTKSAFQQASWWKWLKGQGVIIVVVLFASTFPINLVPSAPPKRPGHDGQLSGHQGQVLVIQVPMQDQPDKVEGRFLGRSVPFFSSENNGYIGLLGIDLQDTPGLHELLVDVAYPGRTKRLSYNVLVIKEDFPVQHLKLPKKMVDLDEPTLKRVKAEAQMVQKVFKADAKDQFWYGAFLEPVKGRVTGVFGSRRIINGHPRNPHSGEDIAAALGTGVKAMNRGVVSLTMDHFFTGKGVIVDHGLGLYSMYFHLSEILVDKGQLVEKGQLIGKVGATGRATGPHLHWGIRLNGARIDPYALVNLSIDSHSNDQES